jgi:hypothetical protein
MVEWTSGRPERSIRAASMAAGILLPRRALKGPGYAYEAG